MGARDLADASRAASATKLRNYEISHRQLVPRRLSSSRRRSRIEISPRRRFRAFAAFRGVKGNDVNRNPKVRVNQSDNRERRFLKPSPPPCLTFFYRLANLCPALQPIRVKGGDVGVGAGRSQENRAHRARSGLTRGVVISNAAAL